MSLLSDSEYLFFDILCIWWLWPILMWLVLPNIQMRKVRSWPMEFTSTVRWKYFSLTFVPFALRLGCLRNSVEECVECWRWWGSGREAARQRSLETCRQSETACQSNLDILYRRYSCRKSHRSIKLCNLSLIGGKYMGWSDKLGNVKNGTLAVILVPNIYLKFREKNHNFC